MLFAEMDPSISLFVLVFAIGFLIVYFWLAGYVAECRGHAASLGWIFGLILGPLGILILALLPRGRKDDRTEYTPAPFKGYERVYPDQLKPRQPTRVEKITDARDDANAAEWIAKMQARSGMPAPRESHPRPLPRVPRVRD
jgi:hypothetical protein